MDKIDKNNTIIGPGDYEIEKKQKKPISFTKGDRPNVTKTMTNVPAAIYNIV